MEEDVKKFREWAMKNYERGADNFIECYTDAELAEFITEHGGLRGALQMAKILCGITRERRANVAHYERGGW